MEFCYKKSFFQSDGSGDENKILVKGKRMEKKGTAMLPQEETKGRLENCSYKQTSGQKV